VSNNLLEALPKRLGDLRCLRKLECAHNQISEIPEEIGKCYMLEDLIAHNNALLSFPSSVVGCAALNVCDLRNNHLTKVPCELGSLVAMRGLYLEGNEQMSAQVPPYCLPDSSQCIFILKMEYEFREELQDLRAVNLELEYKVREREEYNLRIGDEFDESTLMLSKANREYPHEYDEVKRICRACKNQVCCCCNFCSVM